MAPLACSLTSPEGECRTGWVDLDVPGIPYAADFSDDAIYVAAGVDGVWKRRRSGRSNWEDITPPLRADQSFGQEGFRSINVFGEEVLAGIPLPEVDSTGVGVGLYRSDDGGTTWAPSDEGIPNELVPRSVVRLISRSPLTPDVLLANANSRLFHSENGGRSWNAVFEDGTGIFWHLSRPEVVWHFGQSSRFQPFLVVSEDAGRTWSVVHLETEVSFPWIHAMAQEFDRPDEAYLRMSNGVYRHAVRLSPEPTVDEPEAILTCGQIAPFNSALLAHPLPPNMIAATCNDSLRISRDSGESFADAGYPGLGALRDLRYDADRDELLVRSDSSVWFLRGMACMDSPVH